MIEPLYELRDVAIQYPTGKLALRDASLRIMPKERLVLLGPNGCGKTSLLKLLDALILPSEGEALFEGRRLEHSLLKDRGFCRSFRSRVVLLFQHPEAMLFNPTIKDEIGYGLRHLSPSQRDERVITWARLVGLETRLDEPPSLLSGGEKQRLCLACLLALEPEVVLLDEPTTNLDPSTVGWLLDWLTRQSITTVVATHHLSLAREIGDRAVILSQDHTIVFDGSLEEALRDTDMLAENKLYYKPSRSAGMSA